MSTFLSVPANVRMGVVRHEPIDVYHATPAVSKSKLEYLRPRPIRFYRKFIAGLAEPRFETKEMKIGTAFDTLLLEGEKEYSLRYAIEAEEPDFGDCRKTDSTTSEQAKINKEKKAAWLEKDAARIGSKIVLSRGDHALNLKMRDAVRRNTVAMACLKQGEPQVTMRCLVGPLVVQIRPDWYVAESTAEMALFLPGVEVGDAVFLELKTCGTLDPKGFGSFEKVAQEYGYYRQRAFYVEVGTKVLGRKVHHFFLAVEKTEPFEAEVGLYGDEDCALGVAEIVEDLKTLIRCATTNVWAGTPQDSVVRYSLKGWHVRESNDRLAQAAQPQPLLPEA